MPHSCPFREATQRVREVEGRWAVTLKEVADSGPQSGPEPNDKFSVVPPFLLLIGSHRTPELGS